MPRSRPTLPESLKIAEWWKDRGGRSIRLELATFEGRKILNLRTWFTDDGRLKPGKGFACSVKHLPRLVDAFTSALAKARELDLIEPGEADQ